VVTATKIGGMKVESSLDAPSAIAAPAAHFPGYESNRHFQIDVLTPLSDRR
jgi:hypothetical protein